MTKTAGDYGVEIEKSLDVKNALTDVPPIVAEMRAAAGPPAEASPPPEPVNQGLHTYADELEQAISVSNVARVREICDEMIKVDPPTPPPTEPPPEQPVV